MADVKIPKSIPCKFDAGGWSPCKRPSDNGWCSTHENLKCVSCGGKAVKSCDAQMGGLACGCPLCKTCQHGEEGKHITEETAQQAKQKKYEKEKQKVASRTSTTRQMNEELGVPATLFELFKGDWQKEGYELRKIYFLELVHGLMGFFPAVFSSDWKKMVFTTDLHLLEEVWQVLEPREARILNQIAYVNHELGIFYLDPKDPKDHENEEPFKLLTKNEFDELQKKTVKGKPFRWAPGLLGSNMNPEYFLKSLAKQAAELDPTFAKTVLV